MEAEKERKKPLELGWDTLLPSQDDDPPPDLVVTTTAATAVAANAEQRQEQQKQHSTTSTESQREEIALQWMSDRHLEDFIKRHKRNFSVLWPRLLDKGEKLTVKIKQLEEERERRKLRRLDKDAKIWEKPTQSNSSSTIGASNGFREENLLMSQAPQQSTFGSHFAKHLQRWNYVGLREAMAPTNFRGKKN